MKRSSTTHKPRPNPCRAILESSIPANSIYRLVVSDDLVGLFLALAWHEAHRIARRVIEKHAVSPRPGIVYSRREAAIRRDFEFAIQVQKRARTESAYVDARVIDPHRIDMEIVFGARSFVDLWIESKSAPLLVLLRQPKAPVELHGVEIERQQAVETGRRQEYAAVFADDFVTMLEISIAIGAANFEIPAITEQLVAGSNVNVIAVEGNTAQTHGQRHDLRSLCCWCSSRRVARP